MFSFLVLMCNNVLRTSSFILITFGHLCSSSLIPQTPPLLISRLNRYSPIDLATYLYAHHSSFDLQSFIQVSKKRGSNRKIVSEPASMKENFDNQKLDQCTLATVKPITQKALLNHKSMTSLYLWWGLPLRVFTHRTDTSPPHSKQIINLPRVIIWTYTTSRGVCMQDLMPFPVN